MREVSYYISDYTQIEICVRWHGLLCTTHIQKPFTLDRTEIDLNQKRSECERLNANLDGSKRELEIDLNECEQHRDGVWICEEEIT